MAGNKNPVHRAFRKTPTGHHGFDCRSYRGRSCRMQGCVCSLFLSLRSHRVAPPSVIVRNVINHKRHLKHVLPSLENKYFLFRNSSKHCSYKIHRSPPSWFSCFGPKRDCLWVVFDAHVPFCPVGKARHFFSSFLIFWYFL